MESINGIIKTEALYCAFGKSKVNARRIPQAQALERVLQFIGCCNGERPKMGLGMMAPLSSSHLAESQRLKELMALGEGQAKALGKTGVRNDHVLEIKTLPSLEAAALRVQP